MSWNRDFTSEDPESVQRQTSPSLFSGSEVEENPPIQATESPELSASTAARILMKNGQLSLLACRFEWLVEIHTPKQSYLSPVAPIVLLPCRVQKRLRTMSQSRSEDMLVDCRAG